MGKLSDDAAGRPTYHRRNMAVLTHWLNNTDELGPDAVAMLLVVIGAARTPDATVTFWETDLNRLLRMRDDELLLTLNELHSHGYISYYELTPWCWHLELNTDAAYDEEDYA